MKSKLAIIIVLVIAVAGFLFYSMNKKNNNGSAPVTATKQGPPTKLDIAKKENTPIGVTKNAFVKDSKQALPDSISQSTPVKLEDVPKDDALFVLANNTGLSAAKVTYTDNTAGYYITYSLPGSVSDANQAFTTMASKNGWIFLLGQKTADVAVLDFKKGDTKIKVALETANLTTSKVTVQVVGE